MNISIFSVVGPVMVGPSSSHTAGAARLGRVAKIIAAEPFTHVTFNLHGSFAKTCKGHGTDRALVAGVLGMREDDCNLPHSFELAKNAGLTWTFNEVEMDNVHENTVEIIFTLTSGKESRVVGASIGGGRIEISQINGLDVGLHAELPTLVITQKDVKGVLSDITRVLAENNINIGVMRLSRSAKGDVACCVIETDTAVSQTVLDELEKLRNIRSVQSIDLGVENNV